jgi:serine/threonine-protein phosphatase 4 regulatory subunit 1
LIVDKNIEVGQASTESLIKISKLIKPEHIQAKLLGVVVNLAHDDRVEEFRTIAAKVKLFYLIFLVAQ